MRPKNVDLLGTQIHCTVSTVSVCHLSDGTDALQHISTAVYTDSSILLSSGELLQIILSEMKKRQMMPSGGVSVFQLEPTEYFSLGKAKER